jgi:AcrR family transcriptional regulator
MPRKPTQPAPADDLPAYHHGDLRQALLAAAEAILVEQGAQAFTLRECARRAGVSHAAPAHHFGDARGLLTALAAVGFDRMADLMHKHHAKARGNASARLTAVGQAYIDFALRHRAHFQLMYSRDRLNPDDASLLQAANRTGQMLSTAMTAVMAERGLPPHDLPQRMLLAWSAVHGFATLVVEGQCMGPFGLDVSKAAQASAAGGAVLGLLEPALASAGELAGGVRKVPRSLGAPKAFEGSLAGCTRKVATVGQINDAAAQGWAGKK